MLARPASWEKEREIDERHALRDGLAGENRNPCKKIGERHARRTSGDGKKRSVFALPIRHDSRWRIEFAWRTGAKVAFAMSRDEVASIERRDADQMVNLSSAWMIGRQARVDELLAEPANPAVAPEDLKPELLLGSRAAAT